MHASRVGDWALLEREPVADDGFEGRERVDVIDAQIVAGELRESIDVMPEIGVDRATLGVVDVGIEQPVARGHHVRRDLDEGGRRNERQHRERLPALVPALSSLLVVRVPKLDRGRRERDVCALPLFARRPLAFRALPEPPAEGDTDGAGDRDEDGQEGDGRQFHRPIIALRSNGRHPHE